MTALTDDIRERLDVAAGQICQRAATIKEPTAMEKAVELARSILRQDPHFGGAALKDENIANILKSLGIGLATFAKALGRARTELTKKPRRKKKKESSTAETQDPVCSPTTFQEAEGLLHGEADSQKRLAGETDRGDL